MKIETKGKKTFHGGVHPTGGKELTANNPIESGPKPKKLVILLSQHIGAPCKALVAKKDKVTAGQKIGDADAFVSAPVHSPVNGTVKDISLGPHAVLGRAMAVTIETDDENSPKKPCADVFDTNFDEKNYSAEQIRESVRQCGLVGMGGAGFPTRVKIEPDPKQPKRVLIINGCECEPFITCDYRIMLEWTNQILAGLRLARKAADCDKVRIGIEDNKPNAIKRMTQAIKDLALDIDIKVVPVKTKYPQGGERQLISALCDKTVPTGGIPPMIGIAVLNIATAAAIAEAVVCNRPLTHRVVTVTGAGAENTGNFYVPIGITVNDLLEHCGGLKDSAVKVLLGGPMMGFAIADMSTPITKTSGAITVLTQEEIGKAKFRNHRTSCIRCGRCLEVCPECLNPTKIAHAVEHQMLDVAQDYYMGACIECGCCSYVCPANIELAGFIKTGKVLLARQKNLMPK